MSRKIIQMFTGNGGDDCALADDGTTWWWESNGLDAGWHPLCDALPQDAATPSPDRAMLWAKVEERARNVHPKEFGPLTVGARAYLKFADEPRAYGRAYELISAMACLMLALEEISAGESP